MEDTAISPCKRTQHVMGEATQLCTPAVLQCRWKCERCGTTAANIVALGVALPMAIGREDRRATSAVIAVRVTAGILVHSEEVATEDGRESVARPFIAVEQR